MSINFILGTTVEVPELDFKDNVELSSKDSAVIVVDMQNDFVKEGGNLLVPDAEATVPNLKDILDRARESNVPVFYTQDTQIEGDKEFDIWPEHCVEGTWGWNIVEEIKPQGNELVMQKNRYDGFYGTNLEHYLSHVWNIKNLVIVGTVANICVLHTAASAGLRWYNIVMPADGISAITDFDQALTLRQVSFLYAGKIVKSVKDIKFTK